MTQFTDSCLATSEGAEQTMAAAGPRLAVESVWLSLLLSALLTAQSSAHTLVS